MNAADRPVHLRWRSLGLVFIGGALGTAARYGLAGAVPPVAQLPLGTLVVNLLGAFVLGVLLERLLRTGPDEGPRRDLRLFAGTGVLGGFTTYSALVTETAQLLAGGAWVPAAAYGLGTVVVGAGASVLGTWCGARLPLPPPSGAGGQLPAGP